MDTIEDIMSHCQKNGINITKITNKIKSLNESIDPEKQIDETATEGLKVFDDILEEIQRKDSSSNDANEVISLDKVDEFFSNKVSADSCETYNIDIFESSSNAMIVEDIDVINNTDNILKHGEIKIGSQHSENGTNDTADTQTETDELSTSTQFVIEIKKIKNTETKIDGVLTEKENVNSKQSEDIETKSLNSESSTNDGSDTQTQKGELATCTQFDKLLETMSTETKPDSVVEENKNINSKQSEDIEKISQNSLSMETNTQSQKDKIDTGAQFDKEVRNIKNIKTQIGSVLEKNENVSSLQSDGIEAKPLNSKSGDIDAQTQKIELAGTQSRKETKINIEVTLDVNNNTKKTGLIPDISSNAMKSGHVSDNTVNIEFCDVINIISISSESSENDKSADSEEEAKTNGFFINPRNAENCFIGMKTDYKSVNGTKTKNTDLIPDLSSNSMKSEHISDNTVNIEFPDVIDIISISSESSESDISTNSELDSYNSSDFEFITEKEAKTNCFFINPRETENCFKGMKHDLACKQNDFNCMQNDLNAYKSVNGTKTSSSVYDFYGPRPSRNDHLNRNNEMIGNNIRENHSIPREDAYLDLFRSYNNMPLDEIHFLENKSTITRTPMLIQFEGLGFDVRLAKNKRDSEEDEYSEEARESMKKIFDMYPEHNRKRKRRF